MPDRTKFLSSTGSVLSALAWPGSGPDILLVHGLSSNAATWSMVGDLLAAQGARVLALDQRSHGRSETVAHGYDFSTFVADLRAVIEQAGLRHAVVAGQSFGGNVVVELAAASPGDVRAVVGVDGGHIELARTFPSWEECARRLAPPRFAPTPPDEIAERIRQMHPDWSEAGVRGTLGNFRVDEAGLATPALGFDHHMRILESLWHHRPSAALARTTVPTRLLVVDGAGPSTDHPSIESVGFDEVVWLRGDHDLHVQQPELVAAHIGELISWAS